MLAIKTKHAPSREKEEGGGDRSRTGTCTAPPRWAQGRGLSLDAARTRRSQVEAGARIAEDVTGQEAHPTASGGALACSLLTGTAGQSRQHCGGRELPEQPLAPRASGPSSRQP